MKLLARLKQAQNDGSFVVLMKLEHLMKVKNVKTSALFASKGNSSSNHNATIGGGGNSSELEGEIDADDFVEVS